MPLSQLNINIQTNNKQALHKMIIKRSPTCEGSWLHYIPGEGI